MSRPFNIDPRWSGLLSDLGVRRADILRRSKVPEDLFARENPTLDPDAFYRLWVEFAEATGSETPALTLGQIMADNHFDPALFAVRCSPNLASALNRLAAFKPLVGPIRYEVHDTMGGLEVSVSAEATTLPPEITVAELVWLVQTVRMALGDDLRPIAIELVDPPSHPHYKAFFGRALRKGPFDRMVFTPKDASRPFPSPDPSLFLDFEPDLRPRLDELEPGSSMTKRVETVLTEALPGGTADTAQVAGRLGLSTRSLQRKLTSEGTSFKDTLQNMRTRLARHYLRSGRSNSEIAFLLGYDDPNSFIRAFHDWTGTTPKAMQRELAREVG